MCFVSIQLTCASPMSMGLLAGTVAHTVSLLASSFVEEEHQTWYFFITTVHMALLIALVTHWADIRLETRRLLKGEEKDSSKKKLDETEGDHKSYRRKVWNKKNPDETFSNSENELDKQKRLLSSEAKGMNSIDSISSKDDKKITLVSTRRLVNVIVGQVLLIFLCRVARAWNRTGDKWAHLPDIGDWLVR